MAKQGSYGRELALRAHVLLKQLEGAAKETPGDGPSIGSLYPTFLLSMAMPIIIQPYERFFKKYNRRTADLVVEFDGYSESSSLANALKELGEMSSLASSPFDGVQWKYAHLNADVGYKLADGMTSTLESFLKNERAEQHAKAKPPKTVLEHLRNALAHGSIVYLGENWQPSLYGPVKFFLFANARPNGKVEFLLISVEDFRQFIGNWAKWLHDKEY